MVGRDVVLAVDKGPAHPTIPVLRVRDYRVHDDRGVRMVNGLSFEVRAGEIFGVAGVEGNGQRELVEAITGIRAVAGGVVEIGGTDVTGWSPRDISELGVGHVPEDRGKHGLIASFTVADNLVLNRYHHRPFSKKALRQDGPILEQARELVERYDVRPRNIRAVVSTLSGGNQQKVIIARELSGDVKVLIAAQPTRGLDVGSIEFIHKRIIELRDRGVAVLLVSAELDEILSLSDRIGVLYRGALVGTFDRADATRERLGLLMASGADQEEAAAVVAS
jgi:simple sugar transport system ATP-binding protein